MSRCLRRLMSNDSIIHASDDIGNRETASLAIYPGFNQGSTAERNCAYPTSQTQAVNGSKTLDGRYAVFREKGPSFFPYHHYLCTDLNNGRLLVTAQQPLHLYAVSLCRVTGHLSEMELCRFTNFDAKPNSSPNPNPNPMPIRFGQMTLWTSELSPLCIPYRV